MKDDAANPAVQREITTPSELNRLVRDLLEDNLPLIWIEGELSNVSRPSSGHLYFTLKDSAAQIRCAMFKPKSTYLRFAPKDGLHVLLRARVSLYEPRGEYQLIAEHMEEAGEGALRREFERLKSLLAAEGLFEAAHKLPLPRMPRCIGVITSPTGAAIQDVLSVIGRRFPLANIEILPVPVQGKEAPPAIAAMLRTASMAGRYDVVLLTRGGGSLEDLWAFNDEAVARAIYDCVVPVISAIGHEVDFTIADFVADVRAPTPSAAAELLVPDTDELQRHLQHNKNRLTQHMLRKQEALIQRVDHVLTRLHLQRPQVRLMQGRDRLMALQKRLYLSSQRRMEQRQYMLVQLAKRLSIQHPKPLLNRLIERSRLANGRLCQSITRQVERRALNLTKLARTLQAVSPLATLGRGYAILSYKDSGQVVHSVAQISAGDELRARLLDGEFNIRVIP